ncbi:MAG: glycosyltransferase family 4 protein [Chloroflexi bacterium]|nr:glycosyltransferase family 4 protein [Chloroflexota bacterium]
MATRKPRIAILHYASPPIIGGVEATMAKHALLFAERGYAVKIIAGRGGTFDARIPVEIIADADSQAPRVSVVNVELAQGIVSEKFHALVRELTQALESALEDCDVLIAHNILSLHKNLALTAALKNISASPRIRLIAWCHDFAWNDPQYADQLYPGFPWDLLKQAWSATSYVVVSDARKMELAELWGKVDAEISVVPSGIDPREFFGVTEDAARWVRDFKFFDAAPLLILPARLTRRKNIERAIEIVAALRDQGSNPLLLVTGPPGAHNPTNIAYLKKLRELRKEFKLEDAVIFLHELGSVSDETMRDLYWLADALLFPSEREGFGIPILEAALARLPIFCMDRPVFRESAHQNAHYFSDEQTPNEIAVLIGDVLAKDSAYQLKKRVVKRYDWENIFTESIESLVWG